MIRRSMKNLEREAALYIRAWFRSRDLWVMGPPRFRCATLIVGFLCFTKFIYPIIKINCILPNTWTWHRKLSFEDQQPEILVRKFWSFKFYLELIERRRNRMRRRPGIGGLQTAAAARDQYRLLGENVAKIRTDLMKEQLATFRSQLEEFARKHKVSSVSLLFSSLFKQF